MKSLAKLTLATLAIALAPTLASAEMRLRNCTSDEIRVAMFNNSDMVRLTHLEAARYGPNARYRFDAARDGRRYSFVVWRSGSPDQLMITSTNHDVRNWRLVSSGGRYVIQQGDGC